MRYVRSQLTDSSINVHTYVSFCMQAFQTIIKNSIENLGNFNEQANLAQLVKQNNEKKSRARLCKARMQALVTYAKSQLKSSKKPIPGLVGFKNYSASCYINACLQLFLHSGLNKQFFDSLATEVSIRLVTVTV